VRTVKKLYKESKPEDKDYMYPQTLYEFWATLPESKKAAEGLQMENNAAAHQMFHRYYNTRLKCLWEHCCKRKGAKTYDWRVMFDHWKLFYPAVEKKDKDLNFESETNASRMIEGWMTLLLKEEKEKRAAATEEYHKKRAEEAAAEEQRKKKLEKSLKTSEKYGLPEADEHDKKISEKQKKKLKQEKVMSHLATPKDRLIRGKTVVELKTKFPDDKVLTQLLIDEFAHDRIVKRPLEYDQVDSEEENMIKMRENKKHGKKSKSEDKEDKTQKKRTWVDQETKEAKQAKDLMTRFNELSKRYNMNKEVSMKKEKQAEDAYNQQRQKFEEFLKAQVITYRKLMQDKNNKEVPSENKFLSDVGLPKLGVQRGRKAI
jgi:hypothetical protein